VNDAVGCFVCGVNGRIRPEVSKAEKWVRDDTFRRSFGVVAGDKKISPD
jgi:hypothetical protein